MAARIYLLDSVGNGARYYRAVVVCETCGGNYTVSGSKKFHRTHCHCTASGPVESFPAWAEKATTPIKQMSTRYQS